MRHDVNLRY